MDYFFETKNLSVGYNGTAVIENISVQISKGEIVTLIGPNGAGKSTILKSITKHLQKIAGVVEIENTDFDRYSYHQLAKKVAVMFTERVNPELMTCRDVVASGRYPYIGRLGILSGADNEIVDDAMNTVNVSGLADRVFINISDGQRQRILLARAICQQPEILVLDEPTSYLDIHYKLELLNILRNMAKYKNITVIMSLHEIDLAQKISDRIICVSDNRISHFGTVDEIFTKEIISEIYGIENGSYNINFGSVELPANKNKPHTLVISGCGSGIPVFRRLWKEGIPFAAAILYENDIDYQVAKALASEVVSEKPFEEISDRAFKRCMELINTCEEVICTDFPIGKCNAKMAEVIDYIDKKT